MKNKMLRSVRARMIALVLAAVMVLFILFTIAASFNFQKIISQQIEAEADAALTQASMHLEYLQENIRTLAIQVASNPEIQNCRLETETYRRFKQREELTQVLRAFMTRTDYVLGINVKYNDGRTFSTSSKNSDGIYISAGGEWLDDLAGDEAKSAFSGLIEIGFQQYVHVSAIGYAMRFNSYVSNTLDFATIVIFVKPEYFIKNLRGSLPTASYLVLRDKMGNAIYEEGIDTPEQSALISKALYSDWTLEAYYTQDAVINRSSAVIRFLLTATLLIASGVGAIIIPMIRRWTAPIQRLTALTGEVARSNLDIEVGEVTDDEIGELTLAFASMTKHLKEHINRQLEEEKERNRLQTELQMARINPHFIYNTLNSIIWLARMGNTDKMIDLCRVFISILQDTLHTDGENAASTLAQEVELVRHYEHIQSVSYEGRFTIEYRLDPAASAAVVPKLLLQPIVENALYHGILPDESRTGHIVITTRAINGRAVIEVCNDGQCISPEVLANLNRPDYTGIKSQMHSIGLSNLRKRLNLMYPGRYFFRFNSAPNQGTCITIEVPIEHNERKENHETHNP